MIAWLVFLCVFMVVTFFLSKSIWNMGLEIMELQIEVLRLKEKLGDDVGIKNIMVQIRELGRSKSEEEEAQDDR